MISWFEKHNKLSWSITFLIAVAIFYISSLSFGNVGKSLGLLPIIYHLTAFFFLGAFLLLSCVEGKFRYLIAPVLIAALIYGITDEVHQLFVPGRNFAVFDIIIDSVGILFAFLIYGVSLEYRKIIQRK